MLKIFSHKVYLFILLTATILVGLWFRDGLLKASGESGIPFANISRANELFTNSWSDLGLGTPNGMGVGVTPFFTVLSTLVKAGVPPVVVQALYMWSVLVLSGIGIYFLTREFKPDLEPPHYVLAISWYWFNPWVLVNVWMRFLYNYQIFFVSFPLLLWIFIRLLHSQKPLKHLALFGLASGFFAFGFSAMPLLIVFWGTLTFTTLYYGVLKHKVRSYLLKLILAIGVFVPINAWWISQFISAYVSPAFMVAVNQFFTNNGNVSTLLTLSHVLGNFSDISGFFHATFFRSGPFWAQIITLPGIALLSLVPTGVCLWTIYKKRFDLNVMYLGIIFTLAWFLIKGSNPPLGEIFVWFFTYVQPLQVFRNPFEKIGFLLPLASAPLIAIGVDLLYKQYRAKYAPILNGICVVFLIWWSWPFWTSSLWSVHKYDNQPFDLRSVNIELPSDYKVLSDYLAKQDKPLRAVTLPVGGEGIVFSWPHPYWGVEVTNSLLPISTPSYNTTIPYYSQIVSSLEYYQRDPSILNLVGPISASHVLYRGDVNYKQSGMASPNEAQKLFKNFEEDKKIVIDTSVGQLALYTVDPALTQQLIYIANNFTKTNSTDLNLIYTNLNFPTTGSSILVADQMMPDSVTSNIVVVPTNIYPKYSPNGYLPSQLSDSELLNQLYYVKHLPGSFTYTLVRLKEWLVVPSKLKETEWLIYNIDLLGKRVGEVFRLRKSDATADTHNLEANIISQLANLAPHIRNIHVQRDYIFHLLLTQAELLKRLNLPISEQFGRLLADESILPQYNPAQATRSASIIYKFEVPQSGSYAIKVPSSEKNNKIYINGVLQNSLTGIKLEKGPIEVSVNYPDETRHVYLNVGDFNLENSNRLWMADLPTKPRELRLTFDYKFIRGSYLRLGLKQNIDRDGAEPLSKYLEKDIKFHDWTHYDQTFTPDVKASTLEVGFSPAVEKKCNYLWRFSFNCTNNNVDFNIQVRNLRIESAYPVSPILTLVTGDPVPTSSTKVEWTRTNPASYTLKVNKTSANPELLVFSQLFDTRWKLTGKSSSKSPILTNNFANGWWLNKAGEETYTLSFTPEYWLTIGKKVSLVSGGIYMLFLALAYARKIN